MKQNKQKPGFFVRLATWIVDKRNLLFLIYAVAILFSLFSRNWVIVNNDITDYLAEDTETRQGLSIMEEQFTTFGSARVMISNIPYEQALPLADRMESIEGISAVDFGDADDAGSRADHYRDSAALYNVTFDGEETDPVSLAAMEELKELLADYDISISSTVGESQSETLAAEMNVIMGIAGHNGGAITACTNRSAVNTVHQEKEQSLEDRLGNLNREELLDTTTDTGGIAGYSNGVLKSCRNEGAVGYPHVGYNVGGVVGRSSGYLEGCSNAGTIQGRKEVGGVAGQMAPNIRLFFSETTIDALKEELDRLNAMVNDTLDHTGDSKDTLSTHLEQLSGYTQTASDTGDKDPDDLWDDVSVETINNTTLGKARDGTNTGAVEGDLNVGGIAGAMAIEYDFDPEDDITEVGEESYKFHYETRAILQDCVNNGAVTSKKDAAGGVVGRMELGYVLNCENYGAVEGTFDESAALRVEKLRREDTLEQWAVTIEGADESAHVVRFLPPGDWKDASLRVTAACVTAPVSFAREGSYLVFTVSGSSFTLEAARASGLSPIWLILAAAAVLLAVLAVWLLRRRGRGQKPPAHPEAEEPVPAVPRTEPS